jgi:hypothetical protein
LGSVFRIKGYGFLRCSGNLRLLHQNNEPASENSQEFYQFSWVNFSWVNSHEFCDFARDKPRWIHFDKNLRSADLKAMRVALFTETSLQKVTELMGIYP